MEAAWRISVRRAVDSRFRFNADILGKCNGCATSLWILRVRSNGATLGARVGAVYEDYEETCGGGICVCVD